MLHQNNNLEEINGDTSTDNIDRKKKRRISKKDSLNPEETLQKQLHRLERNRISARESRKRQKDYIAMLENETDRLAMELKEATANLDVSQKECLKLELENSHLKLCYLQLQTAYSQSQDQNRMLLEENTRLNKEKIERFVEEELLNLPFSQETSFESIPVMQKSSTSISDSLWPWANDLEGIGLHDSQKASPVRPIETSDESFATLETPEGSPVTPEDLAADDFSTEDFAALCERPSMPKQKIAQQITLGFLQEATQTKPDPLLLQVAENLNIKFGQRK